MSADGVDELAAVAAGKIGAADGASKESVAGEDHFEWGEMETDRALSVARCVDYLGWIAFEADFETVFEAFVRG
jgi:hypothetical protein